jgi:hypothetical protein
VRTSSPKRDFAHAGGAKGRVDHLKRRARVVLVDIGRVIEKTEDLRLTATVGEETHAAAFVYDSQRPEPPAVVLHQTGVAVPFGIELSRPEPLAGAAQFDRGGTIGDKNIAAARSQHFQVAALDDDHQRPGDSNKVHATCCINPEPQ